MNIIENYLCFLLENEQIYMMFCSDDLDKFIKTVGIDNMLWAEKIDGVRCQVTVKDDNITYISRNGKIFDNFGIFNNEILVLSNELRKRLKVNTIHFDTEVASKDKKLSSIMTQLRRLKNIDPSIFEMFIFDIIIDGISFKNRQMLLNDVFKTKRFNKIFFLKYKPLKVRTKDEIIKLRDEYISKGYEGIMLQKKGSMYYHGRSSYCCKVKETNSIEIKIIDADIKDNKLVALIGEYNNKKLRIGGGYSQKQRLEFAKNPPIGSIIEVEFKEELPSGYLRDPRFKRIREDV